MKTENTECELYGSAECKFLNTEGCLNCFVTGMGVRDQQRLKDALETLRASAPEDTITSLYTSNTCRLCKPEKGEAGQTECYALFDMTKDEPHGNWTFRIGKKRKDDKGMGMLLPIQISACKKCRARYRMIEFLPTVIGLVFAVAALIIASNNTIYKSIYQIGAWAPFGLFLLIVGAGVGIGFLVRMLLINSFSKSMELNMAQNPIIAALLKDGWRILFDGKSNVTKMVFAKNRRTTGVYSNPHANIADPNDTTESDDN